MILCLNQHAAAGRYRHAACGKRGVRHEHFEVEESATPVVPIVAGRSIAS